MQLFKKFVKYLFCIIIGLFLLIIILILTLQLYPVQNFLADKAIAFVSKKTQSAIRLNKIGLKFPNKLFVSEIYIEDLNRDTLLYAGRINISPDFIEILKGNITIGSIGIENAVINLSRLPKDSLYNYNFLIAAFQNPKNNSTAKKDTSKPLNLNLNKVQLQHVRFSLKDQYTGIYCGLNLKLLDLHLRKLDLEKPEFDIKFLEINALNGNLIITKQSEDTKSSSSPLPSFRIGNLNITESAFVYQNTIEHSELGTSINKLNLEDANFLPSNHEVSIKNLWVSNSIYKSNSIEDTLLKKTSGSVKSNNEIPWKLSVSKIELKNNEISINKTNIPENSSYFDSNHLNYKGISFLIKGLKFSSALTEFKLYSLSLQSKGNFIVKKIASTFKMTKTSIYIEDTQLETSKSKIQLSGLFQFTSLQSLRDSISELYIKAKFKPSIINTNDILYFQPQLISQNFLKGHGKDIQFSGLISGNIGSIKGEKISIKTGEQTELNTDIIITGLPDIKNANFIVPYLFVKSGKEDILSILGDSKLPSNLNLPNYFTLNGEFTGKIKNFHGNFRLLSNQGNVKADVTLEDSENFNCNISTDNFNLGKLLRNEKMLGPITLNASIIGKGLDVNKIQAKVLVNAESIELNQYNYHHLNIDGNIAGRQFEGIINLNDSNAAFDFRGLVSLDKGNEIYDFTLDLKGANLQTLHFSDEDLRISLLANSKLKGNTIDNINGTAGITKIIIAHESKKYVLDSILIAAINKDGQSEMDIQSALIGIKYNGTFAPGAILKEIKNHINRYFPLGIEVQQQNQKPQKFNFEIQVHNNNLLTEVFLPKLKEFQGGNISGNFDSEQTTLSLAVSIPHVTYNGIEVKNLKIDVNSDKNNLKYQLLIPEILNPTFKLKNIDLNGNLSEQKASINITSIDENEKLLEVHAEVLPVSDYYKLHILPEVFYLGNKSWEISSDNFIAFGKPGIKFHNLELARDENRLSINSVNDKFQDDLKVILTQFSIENITAIVQKDSNLLSGIIDGNVLLKKTGQNSGLISKINIKNLTVKNNAIGDIEINAGNPQSGKFNFDVKITGQENDIQLNGYYFPSDSLNNVHLSVDIKALSVESIQVFANNQITNSSGFLNGKIIIDGTKVDPHINGSLNFKDVFLNPSFMNIRFHLKDETITFKNNSILLNNFRIEDPYDNSARLNGSIESRKNKPLMLNLDFDSHDFTLFNTKEKDNKVYFGKLIIDSKIQIKGTTALPIITSRIQLKEGSNFTFAVPEKKISADKGEGVVVFDTLKFHPILIKNEVNSAKTSTYKGFDISSTIEVNEKAVLKLMVDPMTKDSLVVQGSASLGFSIDPSGKISLTGSYNLSEGSYLVSLKSLIKRKFAIEKGSTIIWNGDPLDADINIIAIYKIRTSPIEFIGNEISGLSETDRNTYRERLPFLVYLKLKGPLLKPDISFEIQLPQDQKGAMGGTVNAKLIQLNEDPSALNKQVFALLVLRRFIQENPLETENKGSGASNLARSSVSSFLTAQLNQYGSNLVPGVELNFDVQSYDDFSNGQAEGRTQLGLGVQKQLLNDRLTVQVGGTIDVEGQRSQENSASDITGDVTVEYRLTEDGRYRLKGFRHNQYEGALEGQLVETGAGILFTRDFNEWKELFKSIPKERNDIIEYKNSDEKQ